MPFPLTRRSPLRRKRRHGRLSGTRPGRLDITMPTPHDMSDAEQARARARIESLVGRLQPRAIDAGSREVLNNLINAWMDQASARVSRHQLEQTTVSAMLIGLAREEVARRKPRYEADYVRAQHASRTLAVTYQELTGRELTDLPSPHPARVDDPVISSTLGATSWTDTGTRPGSVPPLLLQAGPSGALDPEDWPRRHLLRTEIPAPRDRVAPPGLSGARVAAPADPGDGGPGGL